MNKPSPPFETEHRISMDIDISDWIADQRRLKGEQWCYDNTRHGWFRRVFPHLNLVQFHFEDRNEAVMFWLAN